MQGFVDHVNGKNRRGVVERIVVSEGGVLQHGGQLLARCGQKALLRNDDDYTRGTKILLGASID